MRYLPILVFILLAADLVSLIWLGSRVGFFLTFLFVVLDVLLGSALIRRSGSTLMTLLRGGAAASASSQMLLTKRSLIQGICGFLFILPGFVSDILALLWLWPVTARLFNGYFASRFAVYQNPARQNPASGIILEGEAIDVTEVKSDRRIP